MGAIKHMIILAIKDSLLWCEGTFRTAFTDSTFYEKALAIKKKGLLFYEQPFKHSDDFRLVPSAGVEPARFPTGV